MGRSAVEHEAVVEPRPTGLRMDYDAFLEWMEPGVHAEWVNGQVVMMAAAGWAHSNLHVFVLRLLGDFLDAKPIGSLAIDPFNMKPAESLPGRAPDILFVLKKNMERVRKNHLRGPADLVVEIVSPGSVKVDRADKFVEYEQGGVGEYWILDPYRKMAAFYQLNSARMFQQILPDDEDVYRSRVMKGSGSTHRGSGKIRFRR